VRTGVHKKFGRLAHWLHESQNILQKKARGLLLDIHE